MTKYDLLTVKKTEVERRLFLLNSETSQMKVR